MMESIREEMSNCNSLMNLAPKARDRLLAFAQSGYAMAALLVAMSVMAIVLSAAMPVWSQMIRRDKEEELIFRGNQYARAINQYQRKFASASPASLDVLIEQRMLRKKFRDPLSPNKDGEFQLLYLQNQATMGTPGHGARSGSEVRVRGRAKAREVCGGRDGGAPIGGSIGPSPSGRGAIVGVASKNTGQSIKTYKGKDHYNEWQFIGMEISTQGGPGGPPGQRGGASEGRARRARRRWETGRRTRRWHHNHNPRRHLHASAGRAVRAVHPHARAVSTASCNAGRICWMAVFSRVEFTRFVRNTTYRSRSGSIHNEVPVNPV